MFVCFFFSSRRRHTRCLSDWSSDVCSSDLSDLYSKTGDKTHAETHTWKEQSGSFGLRARLHGHELCLWPACRQAGDDCSSTRSEERRVGKSVEIGGGRVIEQKKRYG